LNTINHSLISVPRQALLVFFTLFATTGHAQDSVGRFQLANTTIETIGEKATSRSVVTMKIDTSTGRVWIYKSYLTPGGALREGWVETTDLYPTDTVAHQALGAAQLLKWCEENPNGGTFREGNIFRRLTASEVAEMKRNTEAELKRLTPLIKKEADSFKP
jgi:hypothetical protein